MNQQFCVYYKAKVERSTTWFVSGVLRSEPNMVLERCLDKASGEFEFFVPRDMEAHFLDVMGFLSANNFVSDLVKATNRIEAGGL